MRSKTGFLSGIVFIFIGFSYVPINYLVILHYYDYLNCTYPPFGAGEVGFWACPPIWFDLLLAIIFPAVIIAVGLVLTIYYARQPKGVPELTAVK